MTFASKSLINRICEVALLEPNYRNVRVISAGDIAQSVLEEFQTADG